MLKNPDRLLQVLASVQALKPSKLKLEAYRGPATLLANQRVNELEQLFGSRIADYSYILCRECIYGMAKSRSLAMFELSQKMVVIASIFYSGILSCLLSVGILLNPDIDFGDSRLPSFSAYAIIPLLAALSTWATRAYIRMFRAEFRGLGDPIKTQGMHKGLLFMTIVSGAYYLGFLMLHLLFPSIRDAVMFDMSLKTFAIILPLTGAVFIPVGLTTLVCVVWTSFVNRSMTIGLIAGFPVETILHELGRAACLVRSATNKKLSLRKQRKLYRRIELVARAVELGMRRQLLVGDMFGSAQVASRLAIIANGFRDLKIWLATPRSDTYAQLENRLVAAINDVAAGNWDHLPISSRPLRKASLVRDVLTVLFMIFLGVALSASLAWCAGKLFNTSNAIIPSFTAVLPLIATYLFGLVMPELSARRSAAK